MKRLNLFFTFMLCAAFAGAQTVREAFLSMPDGVLPLLSKNDRADFIDFAESGMQAVVKDRMQYSAEMTKKKDNYIRLRISAVSEFQMKVLPLTDSVNVICTVTTVEAPVRSSHIDFYTADWQKADASEYFPELDITDFLTKTDEAFVEDSVMHSALADINLYEINLMSDTDAAEVTVTAEGYATKEEAERIKPWIAAAPVKLYWKNGKFIKE